MKAIILTDHFKGGGAERVASLLINGLVRVPENKIHVCVFEDSNNYNIDKTKLVYHVLSPSKHSYLIQIIVRMLRLMKLIRKIRPNVIYSFGPIMASYIYIATKISCVKGIKIISSERNDPRKEPVSNIKKKIRDFCYNHADVLVCQTQMAVQLLMNRGIKTKYVIIPNPIATHLPEWNGINSNEIITAARLTKQKNLPLLINAFYEVHQKHPNFILTIYGEGELRNELETLIETKGLTEVIKLPGFCKDIYNVMKNAYMYVSSSDYEGISNSMLEALGIGLPCVCTDCPVGGASMWIKNHKSGILVKVGDKKALVDAIKFLIENKNIATDYSQESKKIKEKLTVDKITQKWMDIVK